MMKDTERITSIEAKIHHENGEAKLSMGVLTHNEVEFLIARARAGISKPLMAGGERRAVLEEITQYHGKEIARFRQQITENNEYIKRAGVNEGDANTYCRTKLMVHEQSVEAIRNLAAADPVSVDSTSQDFYDADGSDAPTAPLEGVVVPIEPTAEMFRQWQFLTARPGPKWLDVWWKEMLKAANPTAIAAASGDSDITEKDKR